MRGDSGCALCDGECIKLWWCVREDALAGRDAEGVIRQGNEHAHGEYIKGSEGCYMWEGCVCLW